MSGNLTDHRRARVWAPNVANVELVANGRCEALTRDEGGWWVSHGELAAGTDYGFSLDGGDPLPDPRSPWQPEGVHGLSRAVDHSAFRWTDSGWRAGSLESAVVYELHTGTFTADGTFDAVEGGLDHLRELGVTWVELMPVAEFAGHRGWGYDGVDLYAPHHCYGGPDGLKRLVNACHARGLAVVLDVVYNHFGPSGNYWDRFGPYTTGRRDTPWGAAVNLDGEGSFEVRRYICDNALMWLRDYHFDGLRLDSVPSLIDTSRVHILEQLATEVGELGWEIGRRLVLIAESDLNDPRIVLERAAGGYGMDAQWSDDFHHALHALLTGERAGYYQDFGGLAQLAKAIEQVFVNDGCYSKYRKRRYGYPAGDLARHRFVVSTQTHDQVGNRAAGERLGHLVPASRVKIAAALMLVAPCVPMLFQGEEWAASTPFQFFTDHREKWLEASISAGRRTEFEAWEWGPDGVPDPQDEATFRRSKLNWSELAEPAHRDMLAWYRRLLALRRTIPPQEAVRVSFDERAGWMRVERGAVTVCFNIGRGPVRVAVVGDVVLAAGEVRCSGGMLELAPDAIAVLRVAR